jgi:hypothetical protein
MTGRRIAVATPFSPMAGPAKAPAPIARATTTAPTARCRARGNPFREGRAYPILRMISPADRSAGSTASVVAMRGREILFEFQRVGNVVKVTAIDAETGIEASIHGPVTAGETLLRINATRRLEFVMRRKGMIP